MICDSFERLAFTFLGPLSIRDMQERKLIVLLACDRGCDTGIHTAGHETDGEFRSINRFEIFGCEFLRAAHYTPRTSGPQMYLCSCNCIRTFKPLPAIQFARFSRFTCPHAGEIRTAFARVSRSFSRITCFAYVQSPSSAMTNFTSSLSGRRRSRLDQSFLASSPEAGHFISSITLARGSKPAVET